MFGGAANPIEQLLAACAQAGRIAQPAFALDEGARAFNRVTGQECAFAANPPIVLREFGRRRHRNGIKLANGLRAVVPCHGDFGGHQRARIGKLGARRRRCRSEGLLGGGKVTGRNPLLGAQQLVVIAVRRVLRRQVRIDARGVGMLAGVRQLLRAFLLPGGRLGLDQAARRHNKRKSQRHAERGPWTSEDRCHTLSAPARQIQAQIIVAIQGQGRLYVVATPIGNPGDLSARARAVLESVGLIAAEDTRHTGSLLKHFAIRTPLMSLHEHNEKQRASEVVLRLQQGTSVALVSDAGTPAISDPGFELVRAAAAAGIDIVAVPGACAAIAALSIGALPTDRFCFEGFLPARTAARRERLGELADEARTLVFYESPHRIAETLEDCAACFGAQRGAAVAREITKLHEAVYRGSLAELRARASQDADFSRGEIVLIVAGAARAAAAPDDAALDRVLRPLLNELPLKQAARLAAQIAGVRDNLAYKRALRLRGESGGED